MSEIEKKETLKETPKEKKKTQKISNNEAKPYCYIGPNIPGGALKQNSIMIGTKEGIKEKYKEEIEKYPQVERLIVSVEKLQESKEKINITGNIINKYYQDIISSINGNEKEE